MRRLLRAALALLFLFNSPAYANELGSLSLASRYIGLNQPRAFQNLRGLNLHVKEIESSLSKLKDSRPAEVTAHIAQTLLFVLTVAGIDLVAQEIKKGGGESKERYLVLAEQAATQILDSGSTWSSIAGAGTTALLLEYPASMLSALAANSDTHKILFESLRSSILSTGTFLGWDAGAQLWTEATYLLEEAADFERVKSLFGTGTGALRGLFANSSAESQSDLRLSKLMLGNVMKVALFDQELRSTWMSNFWRTRAMSGEFVTLLGSVLAAAGIGSMILPGGGTVVGFMFGVAGVAVSLIIPQAIKDDITRGMHTMREQFVKAQLEVNAIELRRLLTRAQPTYGGQPLPVHDFARQLERRHGLRSNFLTIKLERVRLDLKDFFTSKEKPEVESRFTEIKNLLELEENVLSAMRGIAPPEALPFLSDEESHISKIANFLAEVGGVLAETLHSPANAEFNNLSTTDQSYVKFVEVSYARGFNEDKFIALTN